MGYFILKDNNRPGLLNRADSIAIVYRRSMIEPVPHITIYKLALGNTFFKDNGSNRIFVQFYKGIVIFPPKCRSRKTGAGKAEKYNDKINYCEF